jgi:hypothetical protein
VITDKRAVWFDAEVVDACVALLREGWTWGETA